MITGNGTRRGIRSGALALALSGVLFALFPLLRPWGDKSQLEDGLIQATGSPAWVVSHLAGALAFVLLCLGALAVRDAHLAHRGERTARSALVLLWIGTGLTLLFYGAETFALNALAVAPESTPTPLFDAIREGVAQVSVFGVGLLLLAIGAVLLAVAVWRGGVLPRTSALLLAATIALYLPQFFLPPAGRIVHGILTAVGALWLAVALWRTTRPATALGQPVTSES